MDFLSQKACYNLVMNEYVKQTIDARKVPILGNALHIKNQVDAAKLFGIGKKKEK